MNTILAQAMPSGETLDAAELNRRGYIAYYLDIDRDSLPTAAERAGWDDAHGEDCYYRAMWEEIQENESIGRSESLQPWLW